MSLFATLGALMLLGTLFTGCTKYDSYDGESFDCDCGYVVWDGRDLGMRMAEVEQLDSETSSVTTSWRTSEPSRKSNLATSPRRGASR